MSSTAVSVLIPCRNAEAYLEATLKSALSQTLPALEVIVVDDGSTDRSVEIARSFGPSVLAIPNDGRGVSAARNSASARARGEYFQYLDADDLLEPHALSSRVAALEEAGEDVAVSDWIRLVRESNGWVPGPLQSGRPSESDDLDFVVFKEFWAPPAAILYRRSVWERVGGWRDDLPIIQDARFLFDAARVCRHFVHVSGSGAHYRYHRHGSVSSSGGVRFWHDVLRNTRDVEDVWRLAGRLDAARRAVLADAYAQCARIGHKNDYQLFVDSLVDLRRFPDVRSPKFVRAATMISSVAGYRAARTLLGLFVH